MAGIKRNSRGGHRSMVRYSLGGLLLFGALNALAGAYYGISGAQGVPKEWLAGSPFNDYFIPSLILLVAVGGSWTFAAVAVLAKTRIARLAAVGAGAIVLVWLVVEMFIIGYVSWMQPATAAGGLIVLALAYLLPRGRASSPKRHTQFRNR